MEVCPDPDADDLDETERAILNAGLPGAWRCKHCPAWRPAEPDDIGTKYERLLTAVHFSVAELRAAQQAHADGDAVEASARFAHAIERLTDELGYDPSELTT
jgi:hypothetical protein